jgi:hypothetical protein
LLPERLAELALALDLTTDTAPVGVGVARRCPKLRAPSANCSYPNGGSRSKTSSPDCASCARPHGKLKGNPMAAAAQTPDPKAEAARSDSERVDYLIECFKLAKEELLLRFAYRERWLQFQLLAQVVLVGLSLGVEIAGVKGAATPSVVVLSPAISAILVCLYFVDDSIITYIGNYLAAVTAAEAKLRSGGLAILNWDSSHQVKEYVKQALIMKYVAQFIAFAIIPLALFLWRVSTFSSWGIATLAEVAWNVGFLGFIGYVTILSLMRRRSAFLRDPKSILAHATPSNL